MTREYDMSVNDNNSTGFDRIAEIIELLKPVSETCYASLSELDDVKEDLAEAYRCNANLFNGNTFLWERNLEMAEQLKERDGYIRLLEIDHVELMEDNALYESENAYYVTQSFKAAGRVNELTDQVKGLMRANMLESDALNQELAKRNARIIDMAREIQTLNLHSEVMSIRANRFESERDAWKNAADYHKTEVMQARDEVAEAEMVAQFAKDDLAAAESEIEMLRRMVESQAREIDALNEKAADNDDDYKALFEDYEELTEKNRVLEMDVTTLAFDNNRMGLVIESVSRNVSRVKS
jgi:chromosome segregation ATPase